MTRYTYLGDKWTQPELRENSCQYTAKRRLMMRALMVVALAALTIMAMAEDEAKETKRYEVALDAQELTEGVEGLADLLEKKLSGPAKDYYDVLVAKNKLYGKVGVGAGLLLIMLGVCLTVLCIRTLHDDGGLPCIFGILAFLCAMFGAGLSGSHMGLLLAPEYHAMREFLQTASQFIP